MLKMSLTLATFNKKKETGQKIAPFDRRRFKGGRKKEELLIEEIKREIDNAKIGGNKEIIVNHLLLLKDKLRYLNFYLLLVVYDYYGKRNFDLEVVFENFDNDFKNLMEGILKDNPYTGDLNNPLNKHKFRQDFVIYLFLLDSLNLLETSRDFYGDNFDEDNTIVDNEQYEGAIDYEGFEEDEYMQDL